MFLKENCSKKDINLQKEKLLLLVVLLIRNVAFSQIENNVELNDQIDWEIVGDTSTWEAPIGMTLTNLEPQKMIVNVGTELKHCKMKGEDPLLQPMLQDSIPVGTRPQYLLCKFKVMKEATAIHWASIETAVPVKVRVFEDLGVCSSKVAGKMIPGDLISLVKVKVGSQMVFRTLQQCGDVNLDPVHLKESMCPYVRSDPPNLEKKTDIYVKEIWHSKVAIPSNGGTCIFGVGDICNGLHLEAGKSYYLLVSTVAQAEGMEPYDCATNVGYTGPIGENDHCVCLLDNMLDSIPSETHFFNLCPTCTNFTLNIKANVEGSLEIVNPADNSNPVFLKKVFPVGESEYPIELSSVTSWAEIRIRVPKGANGDFTFNITGCDTPPVIRYSHTE